MSRAQRGGKAAMLRAPNRRWLLLLSVRFHEAMSLRRHVTPRIPPRAIFFFFFFALLIAVAVFRLRATRFS